MNHIEHTLPNGLRIVFQPTKSLVGHCALFINTGSRDELENENGMAHFIEHNLFKGTKRRKTFHILSRLDDVGGELNAYTTKEETVIHASFLKEHSLRAIELISDILLKSTFPTKELEKEKDVISDEIDSYEDNPSEIIFDEFENLLFANHPMGRSVLGTHQSVRSFDREMILAFINRNFNPEKMVLSIAGAMSWRRILRAVERYFGEIPFRGTGQKRTPFVNTVPKHFSAKKETTQTHAIIGNSAPSMHHPHFIGTVLLNNLLGGPGMNSRLNLNIREKYGFAYHIESYYSAFTDTGVLGIYVGTSPGHIAKTQKLIERELKTLREKPLGNVQLSKARKQLIGQIALSQENSLALALALGKSMLHHNRIDTLEDIYAKIRTVTATELQDLANIYLNIDAMSTLVFKAK